MGEVGRGGHEGQGALGYNCSLGSDVLLIQWFRPFFLFFFRRVGVASPERYPYSRPASEMRVDNFLEIRVGAASTKRIDFRASLRCHGSARRHPV